MIRYDQPFTGDSGEFYVPGTRCYFTFRPTTDAWAAKHDLIHAIDVLDGVRFGIVRKGVAYVATDEDENGTPLSNAGQSPSAPPTWRKHETHIQH